VRLFRRRRQGGDDAVAHPYSSSAIAEPNAPWIVVGLGNPGAGYERTRHNVGAMTLELLVERLGASLKRHKSTCLIAEGTMAGERVVLARPTSYMNESGGSVGRLVRWYKTPREKVVVLHDEIDIPFSEIRIKSGGGTAGHKGLSSLVSHLGGNDFQRVRIGVSRPRRDAADHVLSEFSRAEREELSDVLERAADSVERVVQAGVERAMTEVNARRR
jgi:peptidyl-tRNA hydrolase, PTH1 family